MPTIKQNPTNINAIIVFDAKDLKEIVPDTLEVARGQIVEWEVVPEETAKLFFKDESPFEWSSTTSVDGKITGKIRRDATGVYEYSVSDVAGNITIDPRIQVKP